MSSPDIVIRIDRKAFIFIAALIAVGALSRLLWSESVTLLTTYPAPSGIYNQLVTTGNAGSVVANTTLSRNAGNTILVPPSNAGGRVGIGTDAPTAVLHVQGDFRLQNGSEGAGKMLVSDAAGNAVWGNSLYAP